MAAFCRFWRITPAEYKQLTMAEHNALVRYANREIAEREKQAAKANKRRR